MAMNPMQRKANNSFLLGILITLLITGIIIAFLIFQISNLNKEMKDIEAEKVSAYVVADTIKSGETLDESKLVFDEITLGGVDTSNLVTTLNMETVLDPTTGDEIDVYTQKAKVDLNPGTVLTNDLLYEDEALTSDVRTQEYNVIIPQSQLQTGEYIDVRLRLPDGQDLIVVSHKQVTIPEFEDGTLSTNNILMDLTEEEILMMSCAIVESYQMQGSMLYATKYVEPGIQEAATPTYLPNDVTITLIHNDPNIVQEAKNELITRYNENSDTIRPGINNAVNNEDAADNVVDKTEEEITGLQEQREQYIESIGG
jgi:hypothetical protein